MTTCDTCGAELVVGQWPWCPHGTPAGGIQPDTFGGAGMWVENLGDTPTWVTGRQDLRAKAAAAGLQWVPEGLTGATPLKRDDDMAGRYQGGRAPTFRTHYRPAPPPSRRDDKS